MVIEDGDRDEEDGEGRERRTGVGWDGDGDSEKHRQRQRHTEDISVMNSMAEETGKWLTQGAHLLILSIDGDSIQRLKLYCTT